jgi:NAD(P)H-dependent flavin oxidoreductase YrpB (nitropropane dioxygenase family)
MNAAATAPAAASAQLLREGDVEGGMWWAGQAQELIDSVESCDTVIRTIVEDAERIILARLVRQVRQM